MFANSVEVVDDSDFAVVVRHVIADKVLFHVRANVFLHVWSIFLLELVRTLQHKSQLATNVSKCARPQLKFQQCNGGGGAEAKIVLK